MLLLLKFPINSRSSPSTAEFLRVVTDEMNRTLSMFDAIQSVVPGTSKTSYRYQHAGLLSRLEFYGNCGQDFSLHFSTVNGCILFCCSESSQKCPIDVGLL